jgi:hypothetical protein
MVKALYLFVNPKYFVAFRKLRMLRRELVLITISNVACITKLSKKVVKRLVLDSGSLSSKQ